MRLGVRFVLLVASLALALAACGGGSDVPADDGGGGGTSLRPAADLSGSCFGWPSEAFTPTNKAGVSPSLQRGDAAVDFTLATPDGISYSLSGLLTTRPVLLVLGAFT